MDYTKNMKLKKPGYSDPVDIQDINGNFDAVDEHMGRSVVSTEGVHGFRYNTESETLEAYNKETGTWEEITGSGGGMAPGNVSDIQIDFGNGRVFLKWNDPDDTVVEGITLSEWVGTKVVRKAGGFPVNAKDGVLVLDSTTRDAHKTEAYVDSGLVNGMTYYYQFFPYAKSGAVNKNEANRAQATPNLRLIEAVPHTDSVLTYNGSAQSPKWVGYDETKMVKSGATSGTDAGAYTTTFTPLYDYGWSDGTVTKRDVQWAIGKQTIAATPAQSGTLTYTGSSQTPVWSNYDTAKMTLGGTTSGTNAGSYNATFTPKANYQWSDGSITAKTATWSIGKQAITTTPAQSGTLTYTGKAQTPSWSNYDSNKLTLGGTTSGTNATSYTATFTPKDNYMWSGGSTAAQNVPWTIGKAAGSLSIDPTSLSLTTSSKTGTITVTRAGDGAISATSSDTTVATVSVSGTTVTVTALKTGSTTITVKVVAGTNHTAPSNVTCSVTAEIIPTVLNDATWAQIHSVSANGANYWNVGDRKVIHIEGTVGTQAFNGDYWVYIIGFNHNQSVEGTGIHFGGFYTEQTDGVHVCLVDSYYNEDNSDGSKWFNMNHWGKEDESYDYNYNHGGWAGCDLRYDILGSTNRAPSGYGSKVLTSRVGYNPSGYNIVSSPVAGTLLAAFPQDLRAVMQLMTKYTDNKGNATRLQSNVTATTDYLPLLAEFEVIGNCSGANTYEQDYQQQYAFFSAGNLRIKYQHNKTGTKATWWLRSPRANHSCGVQTINSAGYIAYAYTSLSVGLSPIFKV